HAIQACIPHARLLPVGVERVSILAEAAGEGRQLHALERQSDGRTFVYDLEVTGANGRVLERWEGLRLYRVADLPPGSDWPVPLLAPYLERKVGEHLPGVVIRVGVGSGGDPEQRRDDASRAAIDARAPAL